MRCAADHITQSWVRNCASVGQIYQTPFVTKHIYLNSSTMQWKGFTTMLYRQDHVCFQLYACQAGCALLILITSTVSPQRNNSGQPGIKKPFWNTILWRQYLQKNTVCNYHHTTLQPCGQERPKNNNLLHDGPSGLCTLAIHSTLRTSPAEQFSSPGSSQPKTARWASWCRPQ